MKKILGLIMVVTIALSLNACTFTYDNQIFQCLMLLLR